MRTTLIFIFLIYIASYSSARTVIANEEKARNEVRITQNNTIGFNAAVEDVKGYAVLELTLPAKIDGGEYQYSEAILSNGIDNIAKTPLEKFDINQQEIIGIQINKSIVSVVTFSVTYTNTIYIVECHINAL
ncbi:hypothetical protein ACJJIU_03935 [Microbulbifer sp. CnH-101-E]|uniref:hypothetical protein n=1 Tax=unclassified Microbulbifer TaxID=2619833 RepID=UPI00403940E3